MAYSKSNPVPFDQAIKLAESYKKDGATKISLTKEDNSGLWVVEAWS